MYDGVYQLSDFNEDGTLKDGAPFAGFTVKLGDMEFKNIDEDSEIDKTVIFCWVHLIPILSLLKICNARRDVTVSLYVIFVR